MITRVNAIVLGIGLGVLWIIGLVYHATSWLTWLDGVGALASFMLAAIPADAGAAGKSGMGFTITAGLFALWIIGLALHATGWLVWLTFVAACAYAIISAVPLGRRVTQT